MDSLLEWTLTCHPTLFHALLLQNVLSISLSSSNKPLPPGKLATPRYSNVAFYEFWTCEIVKIIYIFTTEGFYCRW